MGRETLGLKEEIWRVYLEVKENSSNIWGHNTQVLQHTSDDRFLFDNITCPSSVQKSPHGRLVPQVSVNNQLQTFKRKRCFSIHPE